jgi:hypothetical protein
MNKKCPVDVLKSTGLFFAIIQKKLLKLNKKK